MFVLEMKNLLKYIFISILALAFFSSVKDDPSSGRSVLSEIKAELVLEQDTFVSSSRTGFCPPRQTSTLSIPRVQNSSCHQEEHKHGIGQYRRIEHLQHSPDPGSLLTGVTADFHRNRACRLRGHDRSHARAFRVRQGLQDKPARGCVTLFVLHRIHMVSDFKSNRIRHGNYTDFHAIRSLGHVPLRNEPHEFRGAENMFHLTI